VGSPEGLVASANSVAALAEESRRSNVCSEPSHIVALHSPGGNLPPVSAGGQFESSMHHSRRLRHSRSRSAVSNPNGPMIGAPYGRVLRPLPDLGMPSVAFAVMEAARLPLVPPEGGSRFTTFAQAPLRAADLPVVLPASHSALDRARGLPYRGPGRLLGPDSHRLAVLS
jgi:hypothetical protein